VTEDALPTSRPLPDLIGGRYRIVSRLGVGGMGIVYKAIDTQLNRAVAVKALEDRRLLFPGSAGRLKAEALKSSLASRNVDPDRLAALRSPAGLDLGAIGPEEIALSILAEITLLRRRGRTG